MSPDPKPFRFKQFEIHQDRCAMKVGTDGVLLGAWTKAINSKSVLDIGSGTGLLSLMLAQKTEARIDAVEIDSSAAKQAQFNFKISKWSDRLTIHNSSIQKFSDKQLVKYDLIISNPPYFDKQLIKNRRSKARSQLTLSFKELVDAVGKLLSTQGNFYLILPFVREKEFVEYCESNKLYLESRCEIKGNKQVVSKRSMLCFSRTVKPLNNSSLVIEKEQRHNYTEEYKKLVQPYLL